MASCHTHAAIVTSIGGYGILPYPRSHRSHIHAPIISTYSISGVREYGKMPYPPIIGVHGYGKMPYPPKNV